MKKLLILLSFLFLNISVAQEVSLEVGLQNIIIKGIYNPIKVAIENTKCEDIILKSEDAEIETSTYKGCTYNIVTQTSNPEIIISIYKINSSDTLFITKKNLRVIEIPDPIPTFAGKKGGAISESRFKEVGKIASVRCYSEYIHADFLVSQYTMIVTRGEQVIGMSKNNGNKASDMTKQLIDLTKSGDTVYILDILSKVQDEVRALEKIKFDIVDQFMIKTELTYYNIF